MAEVYAVPWASAPLPAGAYPVWHENVDAVAIARFCVQADSLGSLAGAAAAIKDRREKEGGSEFS